MTLDKLNELLVNGELHGEFPNIDDTVYHHPECPGYSSSFLKKLTRDTPAHAVIAQDNTESEALLIGSALHAAVMQPEVFAERYAFCPEGMRRDGRTKGYQEFCAANPGKEILSYEQNKEIMAMRDAFFRHKWFMRQLPGAKIEHSYFYTDPETGLLLKVRPDILTTDMKILDIKTTKDSASPWNFAKTIHTYNYHFSAAMYAAVVEAVLGEPVREFDLLAIEKKTCLIANYRVDEGTLELGRKAVRQALNTLRECQEKDEFPGYPEEPIDIAVPSYAFV